jgi:predicted MFS family arabinose efflux permease
MKTKNSTPFTGYQKLVILILALTQFTVILDFMIMSPLGDMLMKSMNIKPAAFGITVSAYGISSGVSGLLTAGFADKFDRKRLLLLFYVGFVAGTVFCGISQNFASLLIARIVTGLFGGVIGGTSMAIITDLFFFQQRGRALGFIQMAFGASQVLGVPFGIMLGNWWGWQMPFFLTAGLAAFTAIAIAAFIRPVNDHLRLQQDRTALVHLWRTVVKGDYQIGFAVTALISIGGFMMMPLGSIFAINNLRITSAQLPLLFMVAGVSSLIVVPLIGRLSDKINKVKLFAIATAWMMTACVIYSNLSATPFSWVVVINILLMIGVISRMVPSSALISSIPSPADRGAFMSVNASMAQIAGAVAAIAAGLIVTQQDKFSPLRHYDTVGYVTVIMSLMSMFLIGRVNKLVLTRERAGELVLTADEQPLTADY